MELKLGYIALSAAIVILLILIGNYAIHKSTKEESTKIKSKRFFLIAMILWQFYVLGIGTSGFLANFSFPPRMPLFLIIPLFTFTGIFLYKNSNKQWILKIPAIWLIAFQSFRIIVETLFVYSISPGVLIELVTIKGYNFDMIVGLSAPIMVLVMYLSKEIPYKLLLAWNYFGLIILACTVFLFISTAFFPQIHGYEVTPLTKDFGMYPYVLVAGLLMPSAVFIHILSIIQLKKLKTKSLNP